MGRSGLHNMRIIIILILLPISVLCCLYLLCISINFIGVVVHWLHWKQSSTALTWWSSGEYTSNWVNYYCNIQAKLSLSALIYYGGGGWSSWPHQGKSIKAYNISYEASLLCTSLLSHTFTQSNIVYTDTLSLNSCTHKLQTPLRLLLPLSLSIRKDGKGGGGQERERETLTYTHFRVWQFLWERQCAIKPWWSNIYIGLIYEVVEWKPSN